MTKAAWEVKAGIAPGEYDSKLTKIFPYQEEDFGNDRKKGKDEVTTFTKLMKEAHDYAMSITDPGMVNFVEVNFIWY